MISIMGSSSNNNNHHRMITRAAVTVNGMKKRAALENIGNQNPAKKTECKRRKMNAVMNKEAQTDIALVTKENPSVERVDIDQDDVNNPQCVTDYVEDIYDYMRQLELKYYNFAVQKHQLSEKLVSMRSVLVDWLVDVHSQFRLLQETLYLTINVLDRYLHSAQSEGRIKKENLQLIGVASMFVASKCEEMFPPTISDFVYISDNSCSESQIRQMERRILITLNFSLSPPLLINFLRRFSKAGQVEAKVHMLAKYVLECSLLNYRLSNATLPSKVAAAALGFSMQVYANENHRRCQPLDDQLWTTSLVQHTTYNREETSRIISKLAQMMSKVVRNADEKNNLTAVRRKYAALHRMDCIALELRGDAVVMA